MLEFDYKKPEECGIPSEAVSRFEERLNGLRVRMHGYLLLRGKHIIGERYTEPYGPDVKHRMYSVTKSFTSMAVGLLVKEKKISLENRICDYFPEKLPEEGPHPWCAEMTIRDMLTMRTCYASTTFKRYEGDDWVESFFRVKPDHVPGTVFSYDTSASHVLAALAEKLTGEDMLNYLRRGALNKTGFSPEAYILKDFQGVSQGGSGLVCTLRDMAGAAYLCSHYGILDGEELIPEYYMRQAVANRVPTDLQPALDEQCGYGYMFWRPRAEGFTMYGMGGQLAVCFPERDFCLLTMADTIGSPAGLQMIYDSFYDTIFPYLEVTAGDGPRTGNAEEQDGSGGMDGLLGGRILAALEKAGVIGDCGALPGAGGCRYVFYGNPMDWKWVEFDWNEGRMRFENPDGVYELNFGGSEWRRQKFPGTGYLCECRGEWKQGHFLLHCYVTDEEQGHVNMDFAWKDERLSVRMESTGEPFLKHFKGIMSAKRG